MKQMEELGELGLERKRRRIRKELVGKEGEEAV